MKQAQLKKLREAAKILLKEQIAKPCKEYCWWCAQCLASRLAQDLNSFVNDFLQSDEEIEAYLKKYEKAKKRIEKNNPK